MLDIGKLHPKLAQHNCRLPEEIVADGTAPVHELQHTAKLLLRVLGRRRIMRRLGRL